MELKDVILSTLAEMEETHGVEDETTPIQTPKKEDFFEETPQSEQVITQTTSTTESELMYLNSIRERLLVLFEGFQAPNNSNIEAKVDMTLNFLEYTLATIDTRVKKLEKEV
ncbi:MAG: hypothetical protein SPLUMA2_SPLUMAMAG2_00211 [uncultured Sulfurimonas sp.]|nr:MAG: hypothetical protein SPLUMA1_SPLUMAMAG1_01997 [uncultured Sulfurimonas sp.]CAI6151744.1 MAG: hypothetical protein SPLUMA2_SPLUMAMAG2_00211 [uncultured Sulfurimonas sp.]